MYIIKCDICGHLQKDNERFFHLQEITTGVRSKVNFDFCLKCYERFQNSENKEK